LYYAQRQANRPDAEYLKEVKAGVPENTAAAEYRRQVMEERANAKDEADRQRWMRTAQFFAKWGSTPGPTLVAGMNALQEAIPNLIGDEKEQKKAQREADKVIYDIDHATRLEELGYLKEARAMKDKAAERAMHLQQYLTQAQASVEGHNISAAATVQSAQLHKEATLGAAAENAASRRDQRDRFEDDKRYNRLQIAERQEQSVEATISREANGRQHVDDLKTVAIKDESGNVPPAIKDRVAAAQARIEARENDWETRRKAAARSVADARRRYTGEAEETTPAPGASTATQTSGPRIRFDPTKLTGDDATAYQWATSNPRDPRAEAIKKRLGAQ
jgi:hypothetical protein